MQTEVKLWVDDIKKGRRWSPLFVCRWLDMLAIRSVALYNQHDICMYEEALREALAQNYNVRIAAKILNTSQEVLLIKRSPKDNYSGVWEIPGGAVERGETLEQALAREVLEETGLKVERVIRFIKY